MNGGDPDKFMEFTEDDIQIMITTYTAIEVKRQEEQAKQIKALFGGK